MKLRGVFSGVQFQGSRTVPKNSVQGISQLLSFAVWVAGSPIRTTCFRVVRPLRPLSVSHDLFSTSFCVVRPLSSIDLFPFRTTSFRPLSVSYDLFARSTSFRFARPLSVSCDLFQCPTSFRVARPLRPLSEFDQFA